MLQFITWHYSIPALHPSVGNLLGLDEADNTLYGLASNGRAVIRSHDYGETWSAISMKVWTEAKNVDTFTPSMNLQDGDELVLLEPEEHMVFTSGVWNETWGGKIVD